MDGMEYFNGKLITISTVTCCKRISSNGLPVDRYCFNGTDLWVSDIFNSKVHRYDSVTGAELGEITLQGLPTDGSRYVEDLSVDYAQRPDTGNVPDAGASIGLLGVGLAGLVTLRRAIK